MALAFCQTEKWDKLIYLQMHLVNGDVQESGIQNGSNENGSKRAREWHIAPKELLPVVLACITWGRS